MTCIGLYITWHVLDYTLQHSIRSVHIQKPPTENVDSDLTILVKLNCPKLYNMLLDIYINLIVKKLLNRGNNMEYIYSALLYSLSASHWSSELDHIFLSLCSEVRLSAHPPELHRWPQSDRGHHQGAGGWCLGLDRRENATHRLFPRYLTKENP